MDDETRIARQKAIAEKKRRLEEIKARRNASAANAAPTATATSSTSTPTGNLDDYIDELLKSTPTVAVVAPVEERETGDAVDKVVEETTEESKKNVSAPPSAAPPATAVEPTSTPTPPVITVEKFEVAIQCEEDDFPPPSLMDEDSIKDTNDDNDNDENNDDEDVSFNDKPSLNNNMESTSSNKVTMKSLEPLSEEERNKLISTTNFSHFISTASKRIERLLGSSKSTRYNDGWDGIIDYMEDYRPDDDDDENGGTNKKSKKLQHSYQHGGHFVSKSTYQYEPWTKHRDITDLEWCNIHPEWVLVGYNSCKGGGTATPTSTSSSGMKSATIDNNNAMISTTRHLSPHDPSSSFLTTTSTTTNNSISSPGIVSIYNLLLPSRPEHIFCAGSPILRSIFHPDKPNLILGSTKSNLLVWDARVGRYPVQRSSGMVDLIGMELLSSSSLSPSSSSSSDSSSNKLITASSDGTLRYWSLSELFHSSSEALETIKIDNANLSSVNVMHGHDNEGIICGDERGGMHAIYLTAASAGVGSSSLKRVVRTLRGGGAGAESGGGMALLDEESNNSSTDLENIAMGNGHYGMVTSVAARPPILGSGTPRSSSGVFKGFLEGVGGLVVTTGVDWSTKLWAPAYTDEPLMSFLNNSYDYMCDAQW